VTSRRAAVFLDRDGTIIVDHHYIAQPEQVALLPGAARAVKRLNDAGLPIVVVTNQSGIGRGYFTRAEYDRVHARMVELLAAEGARIEAAYMCPHHPDVDGPCECRKPGSLLYRQAAEEHGLDVRQSWLIGDNARDVMPARTLGARGILIPTHETPMAAVDEVRKEMGERAIARSLDEAVDRVLESAK
jgi:D-glycero-D-manno-heptose 1,7-bisphosphate phosphatase